MEKERIDILLVEQGLYDSREKAKAAIMAGLVFAAEERIEKPGMKIPRDAAIRVKGAVHPYVSRGGLKLKKAIDSFGIELQDAVMLDIGSSTGGFTDCALKHGAKNVYAIDVGTNQLDWSLRSDERVYVMEKTNFRYMTPEDLKGPIPNFASIDVSFISLRIILPPLMALLSQPSSVVALIKPQFEAGRDKVGKSGVIRDTAVHKDVLKTVLSFAEELGYRLQGLTFSPITGGEGNIEFLAHWGLDTSNRDGIPMDNVSMKEHIDRVINEATHTFKGNSSK
ncbi:TlyA family RNA methyltransferase [Paenibacillus macquariensis]|uniref:23S rRNA (Cytidine1920-2'-O)/16S rRNA (Cytidine1409-2'-O)-methyltransferase n=1 Tax=Paenibacillus macquariensis TaxID=948756 RepID=A0ABY1JKH9_9BACL|nr:TlyA family RNA methyltransferase [Paenibacillus macquariensis]MEC0089940.1 TlyA family RNA methyltransferase [Paenibacillus macquariensis]OAB31170.1 RNA methyltransferase [Paenibacillus macquariensis subsp. macquariensis]SIQ34709.1 23S rRNA (cytidine1920-2'-O)/16S rRNA (cytidine1409-2'-O)-methyltransferase [Paenibacillus macquariensis]